MSYNLYQLYADPQWYFGSVGSVGLLSIGATFPMVLLTLSTNKLLNPFVKPVRSSHSGSGAFELFPSILFAMEKMALVSKQCSLM